MGNSIKSILAIAAVASIGMLPIARAANPSEKEVVVSVNDAYIPGGFDSTSDAYVVASGLFPNGCYKWNRADVTHSDAFTHEIKSVAKVSQGMCLMVLVPFTKEIRLGTLASGKHSVRFMNGDGTYMEKTLTIEE